MEKIRERWENGSDDDGVWRADGYTALLSILSIMELRTIRVRGVNISVSICGI